MLLIIRWFINAIIIYGLANYFPGVQMGSLYTALIVVLVFSLINALLGTLLKLVTLPINILTLGLGCLFINGLMFWLTSTMVKDFYLAGFWPAFWLALIYSIITAFTGWIVRKS